MKPSEQLTEEQRKRVREIAESSISPYFNNSCERAILQALDELVPEMIDKKLEEALKSLRHDYSE